MTAVARRATADPPAIGRRARVVLLLLAVAFAVDAGVLAAIPFVPQAAGGHAVLLPTAAHTAATAAQAAADRTARGGTGLQNPAVQKTAVRSTSVPERILIPTIDVDASIQRLSRDAMGVLQPPDDWTDAGWYAGGPVPGDIGAAVIAGHLDTTKRAAVFVALRFLRPGDPIEVRMSDGRTLTFVVTKSQVVQKALFPSRLVYGATPDPQLRLITCSEPFDPAHGIYADNLVVFATLKR